jgi:rhodanese-related sulfurtransferase
VNTEVADTLCIGMLDELTTPRGVFERLEEIQLVDCREQYEWDAGRVEGAIHIPLNSIMAGAGSDLDASTPVVVICRSGNRSELATMMLQARGYEAYNLEGGIEAWSREGLPYSAPDGSPGRVA